MTSRDFCYWLQGYLELRPGHHDSLDPKQLECIQKHLALVFKHEIDPSAGSQAHQVELNEIHSTNTFVNPPTCPGGGLYRC